MCLAFLAKYKPGLCVAFWPNDKQESICSFFDSSVNRVYICFLLVEFFLA